MSEQRTALVTGANRGIGLEVCRQLAAAGYRVVLAARDRAKGEAAADTLRRAGDVTAAVLDVTDASGSRAPCWRRPPTNCGPPSRPTCSASSRSARRSYPAWSPGDTVAW